MAKKRVTHDPSLPARGRNPRIPRKIIADLRGLIEATRTEVARAVNSAQVLLNWQIGHRLRTDILGMKRAEYGERIIRTVAEGLTADYGRGFTEKNLRHMIRFVERFPDREIVSAPSRQLGWTHFRALIYIDDPLKCEFYAEMCRVERWSTRMLERKIGGMLFERTALSRKPEELARQELAALRDEDRVSPDLVFRDPYLLDVRHDNRVVIADSVSRILGRRYLSRPTYLRSKDDRDHSLLVKRWWTTKCPDPRAARLAKYGESDTA
jgi:hypothetical protein